MGSRVQHIIRVCTALVAAILLLSTFAPLPIDSPFRDSSKSTIPREQVVVSDDRSFTMTFTSDENEYPISESNDPFYGASSVTVIAGFPDMEELPELDIVNVKCWINYSSDFEQVDIVHLDGR